MDKSQNEEEDFNSDPYSLFIYALNSPETKVKYVCDMDLGSEELVSVDKREQNIQNQNDFQNEEASHTSTITSDSGQSSQPNYAPRPQATCLKCREPIELFYLQVHIDGCQRSKG